MKKICFMLCICTTTVPLFEYDGAIRLAQQEQWADAGKQLNALVADDPGNPELLYDAGVAAFNNEDYQQAKAYFESAAQKDAASRPLKEQTYFNKANAHVALQELKEALLSYEQVLMLNPDNGPAQHNYAVVKKMLEQQEKQQQQQQNQEQNQDQQDKQDQNKQQDKQQEDKDCKGNDQQGGNQDQSSDDGSQESQDSQETKGNDQKQEGQQDGRDDDGLDHEGDQQDQQESGPDKQQQEPQRNEQRDEGGNSDQSTEQNEHEQQREQQDDHQSPLDKQSDEQSDEQMEPQQQNKKEEQKEQEVGDEQEADVAPLDPKLQKVLAQRSDRDAQLNKQLVKALVSQEMKGQHGQNCW